MLDSTTQSRREPRIEPFNFLECFLMFKLSKRVVVGSIAVATILLSFAFNAVGAEENGAKSGYASCPDGEQVVIYSSSNGDTRVSWSAPTSEGGEAIGSAFYPGEDGGFPTSRRTPTGTGRSVQWTVSAVELFDADAGCTR